MFQQQVHQQYIMGFPIPVLLKRLCLLFALVFENLQQMIGRLQVLHTMVKSLLKEQAMMMETLIQIVRYIICLIQIQAIHILLSLQRMALVLIYQSAQHLLKAVHLRLIQQQRQRQVTVARLLHGIHLILILLPFLRWYQPNQIQTR